MQRMFVDVRGRVSNIDLKLAEGLLPMFEAVINSIHAIEDEQESSGVIQVTIKRDPNADLFSEHAARELRPIVGFEIADNGMGFTESNFTSFSTSDSRHKLSRGGKGVGRFLWLKAFDRAEVVSVYDDGGTLRRRSFTFSLEHDDPVDNLLNEVASGEKRQTIIRLVGFKEQFKKHVALKPETIAQRIIEHCLKYFALDNAPVILLVDEQTGKSLNLNKTYSGWVKKSDTSEFEVDNHRFTLTHYLLEAHAGIEHRVSYCANNRVVVEEKVGSKVTNLTSTLEDPEGGGKFVYAGYVSSPFFDEHVNQQRTGFHGILQDSGGIPFEGELSWRDIESSTIQTSQTFLTQFTEPIKKKKDERIEEYVRQQAPEFRYLLKHHSEELNNISPNLSNEKLGTELYKIQSQVGVRLQEEARNILDKKRSYSDDQVRQMYERFLGQWNDFSKASLAKYIVDRRTTLHFLEDALKRSKDGGYALEDAVHNLIFPMRTDSDSVGFEDHNLWIIDEKLSYHYYLASDLKLKKNSAVKSDSNDRPDIIVFNGPIAVVDEEQPYSSVVILEFKRPFRKNFKDNDNPFAQVYGYIEKIRSSRSETRDGRPFRVRETTPFYCYIICDLTKNLEDQAKAYSLQRTPDESGYFGYNLNYRAYIEVISFEKLLNDAFKRNKILFDKLRLDSTISLDEPEEPENSERTLN